MSDTPHDEEPGADSRFLELRQRPTPELDAHRLWQRIEANLTPRARPLWSRWWAALAGELPGFAYAAAAAVVVLAAAWIGYSSLNPAAGGAQLVLLTPADNAAAEPGGAPLDPATRVKLDVRLVRGYDGAIPDDVAAAAALGVGGADSLADARQQLRALVPFAGLGIVGAWEGSVQPGSPWAAELSGGYELRAAAAVANAEPNPVVELREVELIGAGEPLVAADLKLVPGRLYILGVLPPDADTPSLILLIRAERVGGGPER